MSSTAEKIESKISPKSRRIVDETVKKFTDKDIKSIADSCYKLRSLNNKKNETRREFVSVFEKHHDTYRKVVNTYTNLTLDNSVNGENKKDLLAYYVQLIRERQLNAGITEYILNEVKFGFMKSIVKWIDTPGELDKSSTSQNKEGSNKKQKKKNQFSANKVDLQIKKKDSTTSSWQIHLSITNISKQPLQNIDLHFYDDSNNILGLSEAIGDHITIIDRGNTARIDFLMASMNDKDRKGIDYIIKAPKKEKFENLTKIEVAIENPSIGEIERQEFNID